MSNELVFPIIHLNGTSAERLLQAIDEAYSALDDAAVALRETAPNGRDYYTQPGRMEKAIEQYTRQFKAIRDVMEELEKIADAIEQQKNR